MVGPLDAIRGAAMEGAGLMNIRTALVSVMDKSGLEDFARGLVGAGVRLISTGGTCQMLKGCGFPVSEVSDITGFPEILGGRVKTLHPKIHGGLLAVRGNADHEKELERLGIEKIDLVVANLYPFRDALCAVSRDAKEAEATRIRLMENVDIGGPCMLRAAAKNHTAVTVVSSPSQYAKVLAEVQRSNGCTSLDTRRRLAAEAFALTAEYDAMISRFFQEDQSGAFWDTQTSQNGTADLPPGMVLDLAPQQKLKYGVNPHQAPSYLCTLRSTGLGSHGGRLPFRVLSGSAGYINLLDAASAWQLVRELRTACGMPAAASFKHVSPAGAALGLPLSQDERVAFDVPTNVELTPVSCAYIRARNADPMSSFGDIVALSDEVDEATATYLKAEVSDGVVAPSFSTAALEILKQKKGGKYLVMEVDPDYEPCELEFREVYGMGLVQKRNTVLFQPSQHLKNFVTKNKDIPVEAGRDLTIASITLKYTQSNSVALALHGQAIAVGAGQQSRVDCVRLVGRKAVSWCLRQHPRVVGMRFKSGIKRQSRVNARLRFVLDDLTPSERPEWEAMLEEVPAPLSSEERMDFVQKHLNGAACSSDAFFPFRDNIDLLAQWGVKYIVHPGGSVSDDVVTAAADEHGMAMSHSGLRLFLH